MDLLLPAAIVLAVFLALGVVHVAMYVSNASADSISGKQVLWYLATGAPVLLMMPLAWLLIGVVRLLSRASLGPVS